MATCTEVIEALKEPTRALRRAAPDAGPRAWDAYREFADRPSTSHSD